MLISFSYSIVAHNGVDEDESNFISWPPPPKERLYRILSGEAEDDADIITPGVRSQRRKRRLRM